MEAMTLPSSGSSTTRAQTDVGPRIIELQPQKFAVVDVIGDPRVARIRALQALYGVTEPLRVRLQHEGRGFVPAPLRARWPQAQVGPRHAWRSTWAVPIPPETTSLPVAHATHPARIEVWAYGLVAEITHKGPEATKPASVRWLREFIHREGYRIAGWYEEEYEGPWTRRGDVVVRYPIVAR
jgi:hypothetical protein